MLYLIESFMRDEQDNPLRCLKIGYAKDINDINTYLNNLKQYDSKQVDALNLKGEPNEKS